MDGCGTSKSGWRPDRDEAEIAELTDKATETLRERSPARQRSETEYIKQLAGKGAICEVFGHWLPPEYETSLPDREGIMYRACRLCDYQEKRKYIERTTWIPALGRNTVSHTLETVE